MMDDAKGEDVDAEAPGREDAADADTVPEFFVFSSIPPKSSLHDETSHTPALEERNSPSSNEGNTLVSEERRSLSSNGGPLEDRTCRP